MRKNDPAPSAAPFAGAFAQFYDRLFPQKSYAREARWVHRLIRRHAPDGVRYMVDFGCGTGSHALVLNGLGYRVCGYEPAPGMLRVAGKKARGKPSVFLVGSQAEIPPGFEAVVSLFNVLAFPDAREAVRPLCRTLPSGGVFIFDVWDRPAVEAAGFTATVRRVSKAGRRIKRTVDPVRVDWDRGEAILRYRLEWREARGCGSRAWTGDFRFDFRGDRFWRRFVESMGMKVIERGRMGRSAVSENPSDWTVWYVARKR